MNKYTGVKVGQFIHVTSNREYYCNVWINTRRAKITLIFCINTRTFKRRTMPKYITNSIMGQLDDYLGSNLLVPYEVRADGIREYQDLQYYSAYDLVYHISKYRGIVTDSSEQAPLYLEINQVRVTRVITVLGALKGHSPLNASGYVYKIISGFFYKLVRESAKTCDKCGKGVTSYYLLEKRDRRWLETPEGFEHGTYAEWGEWESYRLECGNCYHGVDTQEGGKDASK